MLIQNMPRIKFSRRVFDRTQSESEVVEAEAAQPLVENEWPS